MIALTQQCVFHTDTIIDALAKLDTLSGGTMVLFVLGNNGEVIGTVTDGDVRRALIKGSQQSTSVLEVMNSKFAYLKEGEKDYTNCIAEYKKRKIKVVPLLDDDGHLVRVYNLNELHSLLPIDAVLMAGGKGERLRPLTENTPKPLLPVAGKAIIDYNIERLILFGVEHISVTVNYLKDQLENHFAEPKNGIQVKTVSEPKFLGTMGSIQYVEDFYNDTVLVMNSDLFTDIDYEDFFLHFKEHDADMSIAAVPYTISVPYGIFELDGRNVKGILEKPTYNYYANAGIYLIKRKLLNLIPEGEFFNATDFMDLLIKKGYNVIRFPLNGTWIDIGSPQEYQKAKELVKHIK